MASPPLPPDDTAFERRLLESARGDARPDGSGEAWARFAASLSALAPDASGPAPRAAVAAPVTRGVAVKWLVLGAIAGSGLTTGLMIERRHSTLDGPGTLGEAPPLRAAAVEPPRTPSGPDVTAIADEPATTPEPARVRRRPPSRSPRADTHVGAAPSTLAAQVALLDAARGANSLGDHDGAMQLVDRYHVDYPDGALAPDADVVALEAAAAKRDRDDVARRAQRFLSRYPNDPHAARVRWLAAHLRVL
jgi:hypothetical protein